MPLLTNARQNEGTNLKANEPDQQRKRNASDLGKLASLNEERESKRSRFQAWFAAPARALRNIGHSCGLVFSQSQTETKAPQNKNSGLQSVGACEAPQSSNGRVVTTSVAPSSWPTPSVSPTYEPSSSKGHAQRAQASAGVGGRSQVAEAEVTRLSDLLEVLPRNEIDFSRDHAVTVSIKNTSAGFVAFKFKASSCMCLARPSRGTLKPSEMQTIRLSLASALDGKSVKEQYLVQAIAVQSPAVLSRDEWAAMGSKNLHELRLPAVRQIIESNIANSPIQADSSQDVQAKLFFKPTACGAEAWLTLRNAANAEIAFRLQGPNGTFTATPSSGRLKALAHVSVCIRWVGTHREFTTRSFLLQTVPLQSAGNANFEWDKLPKDLIQDQWLKAEMEPLQVVLDP